MSLQNRLRWQWGSQRKAGTVVSTMGGFSIGILWKMLKYYYNVLSGESGENLLHH